MRDEERQRGASRRGARTAAPANTANPSARILVLIGIFLALALVAVARLVDLTLIEGPANAEKAQSSQQQALTVDAKRGTIYDRNGNVLAMSVDATTVYCVPDEVTDVDGEAAAIANVLGGDAADYADDMRKQGSFSYVYKKADKDKAQQLEDQDLDGIYYLADTKRVYPCGQTAGQVVGLTDSDGNGISGLELYYNDVLSGTNGEGYVIRGANGYPTAGGVVMQKEAVQGQDIVVSLDVEMQEYLESRLSQAVSELQGKRGDSIIYDGATGEVLACASTPYLNPADRSSIEEGATTLMPVNTAYEPGSIFKAVTFAAILEANVLTPDSQIYCPAYLPADEYRISDAHERSAETMTVSQILAASSNVGTSLAAQQLGFGALYDKIQRYNLTQATGIDFPGESSGYCTDQSTWSLAQSYNVSFGQGIMVTPLQMARFYGALANGGTECQPHFLVSKAGERQSYDTQQVFDNTDAIEPLTGMLEGVVSDGTGKKAQIDGYTVAGKTGTAQYADDSGSYVAGSYNISFVGWLPRSSSQIVCFVGVTDVPGDRQTASAFKDIMSFAINHYGITEQ